MSYLLPSECIIIGEINPWKHSYNIKWKDKRKEIILHLVFRNWGRIGEIFMKGIIWAESEKSQIALARNGLPSGGYNVVNS